MSAIFIPRGALLTDESGGRMILRVAGYGEVTGLSATTLSVRFEDGQDYTVKRSELPVKTRGWHVGLGTPNHQESR